MKKVIAGAALVAVLMGSASPALAETTQPPAVVETGATATVESTTAAELPEVTLTPDQLFYFLKLWVEQVRLAVTRDAAERALLLEQQAQTRLAEALKMVEAGKADLAQQAMLEAQAKMAEASRQIKQANESGKDLAKLVARIEADQTRFAQALTSMLEELPESVRLEVEPLTTDLLVQVAAAQDAAAPEGEAAEEAAEAAEEAGLKEQLSDLEPRQVLVLKAMADASGKSLAEVFALYQENPGLGRIARELGLKMGPVQHAAQVEWMKQKAGQEAGEEAGEEPAKKREHPGAKGLERA
ncbi:MAG: DUF5667 domain-containing protein, partial [Bacillota bacterium]